MAAIPPVMETERLLLRPWRDDDTESLAEIYRQPEYLVHMPAMDPDQTRAQIEKFRRGWRDDGFSHWAVEERSSGRLIGRIGLLRHRDWPLSAHPVEVGWTLHAQWHGLGLATEGGRAALACWREGLPQEPCLLSITRPENVRSRRVMERLGLSPRGSTHWHENDVVYYALDR